MVDGSADFDEFCEFFDIKTESEAVSLNGWIMEQLGALPNENDSFIYENYKITVLSTEMHRISQIEIEKIEIEPAKENDEKEE